jgi:chemotaxis protein MotB
MKQRSKARRLVLVGVMGLLALPCGGAVISRPSPAAGVPWNTPGGAAGSVPWNIVVVLTLLTLLPSLLLAMTPFARLLVVFHFLRQALGTQTTPSNQTLIGLSLILTFFLMQPVMATIYATAQVDKKKAGQLASAIQVAFQQLGAYPSNPSRIPPIELPSLPDDPTAPISLPHLQDSDRLSDLRKELGMALAPEILRGEVGMREVRDGLVISLREGGFFDSGVAELKASSQPAFKRMASVLAEGAYTLRVEGHTDNVRIHNAHFNSNWELSTARSTEMIRLLITQYGLVPQRLSASGYAEFHPIASNDTPAGRALNRRMDVVVLVDHAPAPGDTTAPDGKQ